MDLRTKQTIVIVLSAVIVVCLGWVAFHERTADHAPEAGPVIVPESSQSCMECHSADAEGEGGSSPSLSLHWEGSAHARNGVGCYDCHGVPRDLDVEPLQNPRFLVETIWHNGEGEAGEREIRLVRGTDGQPVDRPDIFNHEGSEIVANVSPRSCTRCHPNETRQNQQSRHSSAANFIGSLDNFLGRFAEGPAAANSGCQQCHGSVVRLVDEEHRERGRSNLAPDVWPNTGIGRVNLDGSWGSCSACHSRHAFSSAVARRPENCGRCHMGPDHPQYEIYEESKHGIAFHRAEPAGLMNIEAPAGEWVLGRDYNAAPTCATCHMSAVAGSGNHESLEVTHDPGARISWTLRPAISFQPAGITHPETNEVILPGPAQRRDAMQTVCLSCHTQTWVNNFYVQFDEAVNLYNEKFGVPSRDIYNYLREIEVIDAVPMNEEMDYVYFEIWHHEGRRARHGASMMGPDYTQWHGFYELARNFYTEFIPLAHELAHEHDVEHGVDPALPESASARVAARIEAILAEHPEHHGWRNGLTPEQRQQMLEFEQHNYESRRGEGDE